jgi:hypothetical protein
MPADDVPHLVSDHKSQFVRATLAEFRQAVAHENKSTRQGHCVRNFSLDHFAVKTAPPVPDTGGQASAQIVNQ